MRKEVRVRVLNPGQNARTPFRTAILGKDPMSSSIAAETIASHVNCQAMNGRSDDSFPMLNRPVIDLAIVSADINFGFEKASFLAVSNSRSYPSLPIVRLTERPSTHLLSPREIQFARAAAGGPPPKALASESRLGAHTVKSIFFRAFEKPAVSTRVELLYHLYAPQRSVERC